MRLTVFLAALVALPLAATPAAQANPRPAAGADKLCPASGYGAALDGVWFDDDNSAKLLFRLAYNGDGTACYAWLNPLPDWGIGKIGQIKGKVAAKDGKVSFKGKNTNVTVDTKSKAAVFSRPGSSSKTKGRLMK